MPRSPTFPTIHTDTNEIWVREYVAVQSFTAFDVSVSIAILQLSLQGFVYGANKAREKRPGDEVDKA